MASTKKAKIIVSIIFIGAVLITLFFLFYPSLTMSNYNEYLSALKEQKTTQGLQSLKARNSDFVGWLDCQDVGVSLPIVVAPSDDANKDFYLNHNFDKKSNELGSPYHYSTSIIGQSTANTTYNTSIVGHSAYNTTTANGETIFQAIMGNFNNYVNGTDATNFNYLIKIETLNGTFTYKVFSAITYDSNTNCSVQNNLFYTTSLTTQSAFDNYVNSATNLCKEGLSFDQTAEFGDNFITLYTCSYQSGYRLMIIAKQID